MFMKIKVKDNLKVKVTIGIFKIIFHLACENKHCTNYEIEIKETMEYFNA